MTEVIDDLFVRLKGALARKPPPSDITLLRSWDVLLRSCRIDADDRTKPPEADWLRLLESDFIRGVVDLVLQTMEVDTSVRVH